MNTNPRDSAAQALLEANRTRQPIPPLVQTYPGLDLTDAYEIQLLTVRQWVAEGRIVKGHKVGLSSAATQRQVGVNQPDYGHLFADQFYLENMPIPLDEHIQPRVEPEVAFVLKKTLAGPNVTVPEAIAAVDYVLPALEVVDSRIADWKIGIIDTIADNASGGGVVLGSRPVPLGAVPEAHGLCDGPQRQDRRDRCRRRGSRVSAQCTGLARQHPGRIRCSARGRERHPAGLGDQGDRHFPG